MDWFLSNFFTLSVGIAIGLCVKFFQTFITKYAESMVANVDMVANARRSFETAAATSAAARLDSVRASQAIEVLTQMSQVVAKLMEWGSVAYFRRNELTGQRTLEDLGLDDLREAMGIISSVSASLGKIGVLSGKQVQMHVFNWQTAVYELVFLYEAAYDSSKKANAHLPAADVKRFELVSKTVREELAPTWERVARHFSDVRHLLSKQIEYKLPD